MQLITRESGVCEEFGYQAARRKACILLVSCRSVTNFVKMELWEVIKNPRSKLRGIGGRKEADQKNAASCGEYVPKEMQEKFGEALA